MEQIINEREKDEIQYKKLINELKKNNKKIWKIFK